jgi:hypothetical protein
VGSCKYGDEPLGSGVMDLVSYFVTFFVLGPNIFLRSLLPHTPSTCVPPSRQEIKFHMHIK